MTPEEFVTLSAVVSPALNIDDVYDAHPAMLPLVRLMEKAMTLPSDVQVWSPGGGCQRKVMPPQSVSFLF